MRILHGYVPGQTRLGIFTNLGFSAICAIDRRTLGCWYLSLHVGAHRWEVTGTC